MIYATRHVRFFNKLRRQADEGDRGGRPIEIPCDVSVQLREKERERAILSKILSSRSLSYSHDYSAPWGMILTNWAALRFNSLSLLSNSSLVANVSSYFGLIPISSFQFIFFVLFTEKRSSSVPNVSPRPRFSFARVLLFSVKKRKPKIGERITSVRKISQLRREFETRSRDIEGLATFVVGCRGNYQSSITSAFALQLSGSHV